MNNTTNLNGLTLKQILGMYDTQQLRGVSSNSSSATGQPFSPQKLPLLAEHSELAANSGALVSMLSALIEEI